jgi:hypothetical protein
MFQFNYPQIDTFLYPPKLGRKHNRKHDKRSSAVIEMFQFNYPQIDTFLYDDKRSSAVKEMFQFNYPQIDTLLYDDKRRSPVNRIVLAELLIDRYVSIP